MEAQGNQGVRAIRAEDQRADRETGGGRATAFNFTGDFAYFTPGIPHQERNLSATESVEFLVVRSDSERIAVPWED